MFKPSLFTNTWCSIGLYCTITTSCRTDSSQIHTRGTECFTYGQGGNIEARQPRKLLRIGRIHTHCPVNPERSCLRTRCCAINSCLVGVWYHFCSEFILQPGTGVMSPPRICALGQSNQDFHSVGTKAFAMLSICSATRSRYQYCSPLRSSTA
jgi:hypothetical protein